MSANDYHCPTDEELCERQITRLFKAYKIDRIQRPLPLHIKQDIARALENIGWSCWFADWINHRIYCWVLEINATSSNPELEEFIHFEDIPRDSESEEEDDMRLDEEEEPTKYQVRTYLDDGNTDFYEYNGEWDFDNLETAKEALESAKLWVKQKDRKYLIGLALTKVINDDDDFEVIEEVMIDNTGDGNESEEEIIEYLAEEDFNFKNGK